MFPKSSWITSAINRFSESEKIIFMEMNPKGLGENNTWLKKNVKARENVSTILCWGYDNLVIVSVRNWLNSIDKWDEINRTKKRQIPMKNRLTSIGDTCVNSWIYVDINSLSWKTDCGMSLIVGNSMYLHKQLGCTKCHVHVQWRSHRFFFPGGFCMLRAALHFRFHGQNPTISLFKNFHKLEILGKFYSSYLKHMYVHKLPKTKLSSNS